MFFGHPQLAHKLAHTGAAHVTRKGRVYYYRRRLPVPIGGEVGLSLRTTRYREAEHFASLLDRKLAQALAKPMATTDLTAILREYLDDLRARYRDHHRGAAAGRSVFGLPVEEDDDPVDLDLEFVSDLIGDNREAISRRDWRRVPNLELLLESRGVPEEQRAEFAEGALLADITALQELSERLEGRPVSLALSAQSEVVTPSLVGASGASHGPVLSEVIDEFLTHAKTKRQPAPWPDTEAEKARRVYALFIDWCEDKPVSSYKRSEIYDFYRALGKLPKNHGKSPEDAARTMQDRIEIAEESDVETLAAKTMKGYATKLIALFEHFKDHDDDRWRNPAAAFGKKFHEYGRGSMVRAMWEGDTLVKLMSAPAWTGAASEHRPREVGSDIYANERYWLPVLALYHGARLEELARLVRAEVVDSGPVSFLLVTDALPPVTDGEAPIERKHALKTEAAKRRLPIHSVVLGLGFLEYVRRVAPAPGDQIFPRLKPNPRKENQRSGKFSQWFTAYRRDVGIEDPRYVFHSFRHGVATKLLASDNVALGSTIAIIGNAWVIAKDMNAATLFGHYLRAEQIPIEHLKETIERVSFSEVTLRRPTVYSDGTAFPQK